MVNYYEQKKLWSRELTFQETERLDLVNRIIPSDVKSILDVGCGNGALTNYLDSNIYEITGVDRSKEALKYYKHNKIEASVDNLPFNDNTFDLVICSDVMEHLPQEVLEKTIDELKRVSKKYLLIISPNNEELLQNSTKCKNCNTIYHINDHLYSFNENTLKRMFNDSFQVKLISYFGDRWNFKHPEVLKVAHELDVFIEYENAICPNCGTKSHSTDFESIENSKIVLNAIENIKYKKYNEKCEILILFEIRKKILNYIGDFFSKKFKNRLRAVDKKFLSDGLYCTKKEDEIYLKKGCYSVVSKNIILLDYSHYQIAYLEQSPLFGKIIVNENSNWYYDKDTNSVYFKNNHSLDNHATFIFPTTQMLEENTIEITYSDDVDTSLILQYFNGEGYHTIGILKGTNSKKEITNTFTFNGIRTLKNHILFRLVSFEQTQFSIKIKSISFNSNSVLSFYSPELKQIAKEIIKLPYNINDDQILLSQSDELFLKQNGDLYYLNDGVFTSKGSIK